MAGGAIAGGLAGAKLGAAIGSIIPGAGTVIGAGIGTIAGGALGAFAGSKAGKAVGEAIGGGINTVKNFFGGSDVGEKTKEAVTGSAPTTDIQFSETEFAKSDPQTYQKFVEFKDKRTTEISNEFAKKSGRDKPNQADVQVARAKAKVEAIEKFKKEIEASGAGKSEAKVEKSSDNKRGAYAVQVSKSDSNKKRAKEEKYDSELIDGLQAQRDRVAERGPATDSLQSKKAHENVLSSLDKNIEDKKSKPREGKLSEATSVTTVDGKPAAVAAQPTSLNEIAMTEAKKYGRDTPNIDDKKAAQLIAKKGSMGSTVAQTSTENADMTREASGRGGNNNTVVSNNVSNNETTKFMPSKPSPRPEFTGSALDRYLNNTAVY